MNWKKLKKQKLTYQFLILFFYNNFLRNLCNIYNIKVSYPFRYIGYSLPAKF